MERSGGTVRRATRAAAVLLAVACAATGLWLLFRHVGDAPRDAAPGARGAEGGDARPVLEGRAPTDAAEEGEEAAAPSRKLRVLVRNDQERLVANARVSVLDVDSGEILPEDGTTNAD